jgi:[acyl-carrier-protein] S-malonyltransferase
MRLALLFSGQGLQQPIHLAQARALASPALAQAIARELPETWDHPSPDPARLCTNALAQPLIFGLQLGWWQTLETRLPRPVCVAGYSLGEMAACAVAGLMDGPDGVALCATRARLMDACVDQPAGLLALRGPNRTAIDTLAARHGLALAICNGPTQHILGGLAPHLAQAEADARQLPGLESVQRLAVSTPSHTPLLAQASAGFLAHLPATPQRLRIPVLSAQDGQWLRDAPSATQALARQISHTLDWARCLDAVRERQPDAVLEIGPGTALTRLWSERHPDIPARAVDEFRGVEGVVDWVQRCGKA